MVDDDDDDDLESESGRPHGLGFENPFEQSRNPSQIEAGYKTEPFKGKKVINGCITPKMVNTDK
tara:strand:- start:266 stop:457 length:192 start_codon:yes stop_codon:yes gene_type:complete